MVDDEVAITEVLNRQLQRHEIEVLVAHNGVAAIEFLEKYRPTLVVCDISLPGSASSMDVLRKTRELNPDAHFIIISGKPADDITVEIMIDSGADLFIKKPFDLLSKTSEQIISFL